MLTNEFPSYLEQMTLNELLEERESQLDYCNDLNISFVDLFVSLHIKPTRLWREANIRHLVKSINEAVQIPKT